MLKEKEKQNNFIGISTDLILGENNFDRISTELIFWKKDKIGLNWPKSYKKKKSIWSVNSWQTQIGFY